MPKIVNNETFVEVYNDDYQDSDNYYRILFNNGRPIQQRELNQLQTIINNEMERFGRNIFKEGAAVKPSSNISANRRQKYVKVTQTSLPATDVIGLEFTGQTTGVIARVVDVAPYIDAQNPLTLYIEYVNTDTPDVEPNDLNPITFAKSENIQNIAEGITFTVSGVVDATGYGTRASVDSGIFFVRGHFVFTQAQTIIVSRYSNYATTDLGFEIKEDIVTVDDTTDLYDNVGATPDLSAPGADRYRISLTLTTSDFVANTDDFVSVARIVGGEVVSRNDGRRDYNRIYDVMAQRTYEESGNYTVTAFQSNFETNADPSLLTLNTQRGLAYVKGFRSEPGPSTIDVSKPTVSQLLEDEPVSASYGNYVLCEEPAGLFRVDQLELVQLKDSLAGAGNVIGSARVRSVEFAGSGYYRLYLFAVTMNTSSAFRDVLSVTTTDGRYADLYFTGPYAKLLDINNNDLLFKVPRNRPDWTQATSFDMSIQKTFVETSNLSGEVVVDTGGNGTFTQTSEWLVFDSTNSLVTVPLANFGSTGGTSLTITGLNSGEQYQILTLIDLSNVPPRKKTITTFTLQGTLDGNRSLSLQRADIINVVSVIDDSTGVDITQNFNVDSGTRDNYYGIGKITLAPGYTLPATTVTVSFRYFAHSSTGGYFFASSYADNPGFTYSDIPQYRKSTGEFIALREHIDFRPTLDYAGSSFTNNSQGGRVNLLPRNTDTITSGIAYYLPRKDILTVSTNEQLIYTQGVPSFDPEFPSVPENNMLLYKISLGANTLNLSDIDMQYVAQKRYTMEDIARIDERVRENRELITLSLLELETSTLEVLDENGLPRSKAGFFVENFANFNFADTSSGEHNVSLNPETKVLTPSVLEKSVPYLYDSDNSEGVRRKGSLVLLDYTDELFIDQPQASSVINVNPFNVITNIGSITITPSQDNWRDTKTSESTINVGPQTPPSGFQVSGTSSSTRVSTTEIRISKMRSREVAVKVEGLMPLTRHFPFFGQKDITKWCKQISESQYNTLVDSLLFDDPRISSTEGLTERPDGYTSGGLTTSVNGEIFMSFLIPSNETLQFDTGSIEFAVFDIRIPSPRDAASLAATSYTAEGILERIQRTTEIKTNFEEEPRPPIVVGPDEPSKPKHTAPTAKSKGSGYIRITTNEYSGILQADGSTIKVDMGGFGSEDYEAWSAQREIEKTENAIKEIENWSAADERHWTTLYGGTKESRLAALRAKLKPVGTCALKDPIAQSFNNDRGHGVFVTQIGVYLATKDAQRPLVCELRPLVNGYPSSREVLRFGSKSKNPSEITVSSDATAETVFEFDSPVYLEAGTEYALVLLSESDGYFAWRAVMNEFEVGTTDTRITSQPTLGSLFVSQNASTWEPDQESDLKFRLYVANFSTSNYEGLVKLYNAEPAPRKLQANPFIIENNSSLVRVQHPYHGMIDGDQVEFFRTTNIDSDNDGTTDFIPGVFENQFTILNPDARGYSINLSSAATVDEIAGGNKWEATDNAKYHGGRHESSIFEPEDTNVVAFDRKTQIPSLMQDASFGYTKDTNYKLAKEQADVRFQVPYVIASRINETARLAGGRSLELQYHFSSRNLYTSPAFLIEDTGFMTLENKIDWQDDSDLPNRVVPYLYVDETEPTGGSSLSKYLTKNLLLENSATGLLIILAANRPKTTDFDVYYKTATESEELDEQPWVLAIVDQPQPADDDKNVYREYRYTVGGVIGGLPEFTKYKVKLVMKSYTEALIPRFKDLRVIALSD